MKFTDVFVIALSSTAVFLNVLATLLFVTNMPAARVEGLDEPSGHPAEKPAEGPVAASLPSPVAGGAAYPPPAAADAQAHMPSSMTGVAPTGAPTQTHAGGERQDPSSGSIVGVFATWCGHCVDFKPEWEKFVASSPVPTKQLDADADAAEIAKLGVKSYPTVLHVTKDGMSHEYAGKRDAASLVEWAKGLK